jgi:LacI family transcriptional regulator
VAKRPTMVDIGARAGVSQATVSLVLNGVPNARVAAATRARILQAAEELGYSKSPHHISSGGRIIGMLIDEVSTTPFAAQFIEAARDEAALHDVVVATFCTGADPTLEEAVLNHLLRSGLVGILYTKLVTGPATPPARLASVPTILLNCYERKRQHTAVVPGDVAGAYAATEELLRSGHTRIAHIAGEEWLEAARDREKGFRQAMATWDVAVDPDLIMRGAWTVHGGRELTNRLLDMREPPTAIFCFNDRMAVGAYDAIHSRGGKIPEDISLVGFDDEEIASYMSPELSTVVLPHEEMARWAVNALLEERLPTVPPRKIKIECPLILRGSIGAPRSARTKNLAALDR